MVKRSIPVVLLLAAAVAWAAPRSFHVGVGKPPSRILRGATATGGTLTVARASATLMPDGSLQVVIAYVDAGSHTVHTRVLTAAADGSKVTDNYGTVIATPVPSSIVTNCGACASALDTAIGNCATSGLCNL